MKKIILSLVALLSISACTTYIEPTLDPFPEFPDPQKIAFELPRGTVSQADSDYYFTSNKIDIIDIDNPDVTVNGTTFRQRSLRIDGLIDQSVEDAINTKVAEKFESLKRYADFNQIPVRPGLYAAYESHQRIVKGLGIYVDAYFNSNNILSLLFVVQVYITRDINTYQEDFTLYDTLNFDLNTGNELVLSDLFVNDSDWEAILNERILMKSQHRTDPLSWDLTYNDPAYEYLGGFDGINGDIKFVLDSYNGTVSFLFNESYTEFRNGFSTVRIDLPMKDLKDILAFGQRFTLDKPYLFTQSNSSKTHNYLYPSYMVHETQTIESIKVSIEHYYDDTLSAKFKVLRTTLMNRETDFFSQIKVSESDWVYWTFSAKPNGVYMNVTSVMQYGEDKHILSGTYREDGHKLTFKDVYADGFDYRARFIAMIKKELADTADQQDKVYDPDELFDALAPSLQIYCYFEGECHVSISNDFIFDAAWDPGYFSFSDPMTDDPAVFKIKAWK